MSSEDMSLVTSQNGLNSQLLFQEESLRFSCGPPQRRVTGDPGPKTRELSAFIDDKLFSTNNSTSAAPQDRYFQPPAHAHDFPRNIYRQDTRNWNSNGNGSSGDDDSDGDDEDDDDDEDDVDDDDADQHNQVHGGLVGGAVDNSNNNSQSNKTNANNVVTTATTSNNGGNLEKMGNGNGKAKNHSTFGAGGELMVIKDGGGRGSIGGQASNNAVTIAEPDGDMYYSQYLQTSEGPAAGGKDIGVDNGCGFSGRKEVSSFFNESGESLRNIFSDPFTGALMDDAVILPCGHSFGSGGVQHIIRMKACYTCSRSVSEDSIAPNLSLRAAVQAFRREEEMLFYRSSKRRRERSDQDKGGHGDTNIMDHPKGRGVQFPFAVTDRVIIKGNKRTPQRFVGREAVVTTQCLNGWYVVKTLDNAESVKLQYRSLAKVSDESPAKTMPSKMGPNWL